MVLDYCPVPGSLDAPGDPIRPLDGV